MQIYFSICIRLHRKMFEMFNVHNEASEWRQAVVWIVFKRLYLVATGNHHMVIIYSGRECCDMYLIFGQCKNDNVLRAAGEYSRRYPSRRLPIANVIRRLRSTGNVYPTISMTLVEERTMCLRQHRKMQYFGGWKNLPSLVHATIQGEESEQQYWA